MTKSELWLHVFLKYTDGGWCPDAAGRMADQAVETAKKHLEQEPQPYILMDPYWNYPQPWWKFWYNSSSAKPEGPNHPEVTCHD